MKNASSHKNFFYTGYAVFLYSGKVKKGKHRAGIPSPPFLQEMERQSMIYEWNPSTLIKAQRITRAIPDYYKTA